MKIKIFSQIISISLFEDLVEWGDFFVLCSLNNFERCTSYSNLPPDIQLNTDLKCTYWRHSDISLQFYIFRISKFNSCVHQSSVLVVSFRVSSFISVIGVIVKLHSYFQSQLQFPGGLNPSNVNIQCSCSLKVLICFYFQDVVYALAHATGKTGRFTLIERWRNNERLLAPQEHPLKVNITKYFSRTRAFRPHSYGRGRRGIWIHEHFARTARAVHRRQEVTLAQHVNYCFVPGGRVFSSANRHFFQLIFVVNQIKV